MLKLRAEWRGVKEGAEFERLTVLGPQFRLDLKRWFCVCRCKCGTICVPGVSSLKNNRYRSCGCLHRDTAARLGRSKVTHGASKTPLYEVWVGMKQRCLNKNDSAYKNYGGRGIQIWEDWIDDFSAFQKWALSHGYREGLEIDRFPNNDGNYHPDNCRFTTPKKNSNNRRSSRKITWDGETKTLAEWSEDPRCCVAYDTLKARLKYGWSFQKALTSTLRY